MCTLFGDIVFLSMFLLLSIIFFLSNSVLMYRFSLAISGILYNSNITRDFFEVALERPLPFSVRLHTSISYLYICFMWIFCRSSFLVKSSANIFTIWISRLSQKKTSFCNEFSVMFGLMYVCWGSIYAKHIYSIWIHRIDLRSVTTQWKCFLFVVCFRWHVECIKGCQMWWEDV